MSTDVVKKCRICGTQFDNELHQDCGGDCLLCMAEAGDPDCAVSAVPWLRQQLAECQAELAKVKENDVCAYFHRRHQQEQYKDD